jgi:pimeloyl-ACP methyl ester carboxylesterase
MFLPCALGAAPERRIEVPLESSGGLAVAEVVSALAKASGAPVEPPTVRLTLPTRGLAGTLTRTLLAECLGPEVAFVFQPATVVMIVSEEDLATDRKEAWKHRLEELATRSRQAAQRQQYYGMRALRSYRPNDPERPTICLVHGLNASSGGFVHMIPHLEKAGYGIVVYDYPFNQRLEESCTQFRRDLLSFRKERGELRPWAFLAHSMGALVARSYVEGGDAPGRDVASVILIAPVNQGAHVARIQPVFQTISSLYAINNNHTSHALAMLSEGIGQAAEDLLPGSEFLRRMNARPRAAGVRYHILAGDKGMIPREIGAQVMARLSDLGREKGLFSLVSRLASRDMVPLLQELGDDTGDGCVSVASTRLKDVEDHVTIRANHVELIRAPLLFPDDGPVVSMPYVLRWLAEDMPH